jgi:hypothetical protein
MRAAALDRFGGPEVLTVRVIAYDGVSGRASSSGWSARWKPRS